MNPCPFKGGKGSSTLYLWTLLAFLLRKNNRFIFDHFPPPHKPQERREEQGRIRTHYKTDSQRKGKSSNRLCSEKQECKDCQQGCNRCIKTPCKCLDNTLVDCCSKLLERVNPFFLPQVIPDTVKGNDTIINGIPDNGQYRCDNGYVEFNSRHA